MSSRALVFVPPSLVICALVACGGSRPPPTSTVAETETETTGTEPEPTPVAPPAPAGRIRLIHAAIESRDQAVSLASDGESTAATAYQFSSAYLALSPGEHTLSARAPDAELIEASFDLADGQSTIVAYSTGDFPVALSLGPDTQAAASANSAQIRVFHAIVAQGAVDVCVPPTAARGDGTPILANVAAGTFGVPDGSYVSVAAGTELVVQLRARHATPCHGRVVGTAHGFTPVSESNYTLVFVGRSGRRGSAPELLFCADPPAIDTSCATVAFDAH